MWYPHYCKELPRKCVDMASSREEGKANWKVNKRSEEVVALFNVRQAQGYKKVKVKTVVLVVVRDKSKVESEFVENN